MLMPLQNDMLKLKSRNMQLEAISTLAMLPNMPPNATEKTELDRHLAEDDVSPDDTVTWETIKAEAQSRWQR